MPRAAIPRFLVGTSGFSYAPWRGTFYPKELPTDEMLSHYATVFRTVEINHSFYRMPAPPMLEKWTQQTPSRFRFALKAPQRITHHLRLKDAGDATREFVRRVTALGDKLGPLLFQLPPHLRADPERLESFLAGLPSGCEVAMEFRHASWFDEEIYAILARHRVALCIADTDESTSPIIGTAAFGYVRLRRDDYTDAALAAWAERLRAVPRWKRIYVFLKHDEAGRAPELANAFLRTLD